MQSKSPSETNRTNEVDKTQLQMKKKTPAELAQMAIVNRAFSAESIDEPPPLSQKRSETSLDPLKTQLKSVPLVKAFNSAENHLEEPPEKK
ncbi:unnamed protein product [Caenorhabditis sp. 36 PRJEB53466]|nr:unnamed protein product [Caenorhabditis sp. 36 PRJEB53466]